MERLIKFPFPKHSKCFDDESVLINIPCCLCYQYNVGINGCGPYGFNTTKAQSILKQSFRKLYFWDDNKKDCIEVKSLTLGSGLYFYDEELWVESEKKNMYSYLTIIKKNDFFKKRGRILQEVQNPPFLLEVYKDGLFNVKVLNQLIITNIHFFIVHFFTPEAGSSLIFFDDCFIKKIECAARSESVDLIAKSSINKLYPW